MRHNKKFNHLGRKAGHRKAMLANMAVSLIVHKRISTTVAKAKALRMYIEPIITKSKDDSTHSRRTVFSYLKDKEAVTELFRAVSPKIMNRPGGYTRILKTGFRLGDAADMCIIELVDFNENYTTAKADNKSKTRRSRSGAKKDEGAAEAKPAAEKAAPKTKAAEPAVEAPVEEAPVAETPATEAPEATEEKAAE